MAAAGRTSLVPPGVTAVSMTAKGAVCLVAGIPAGRPSPTVSSPVLLNAVFDIVHPGRAGAYVWVFRGYHTGKPKHIFDWPRLQWRHGGQPGGPWLPAGYGRAFNHTPRMRRAAKSSYVQTSPFAATITAVAPDGTREARPAARCVCAGETREARASALPGARRPRARSWRR